MTNSKQYFEKQLLPVVKKLPCSYGILASTINPTFPRKRLYNTVQGSLIDWEALELLKQVVEKFGAK